MRVNVWFEGFSRHFRVFDDSGERGQIPALRRGWQVPFRLCPAEEVDLEELAAPARHMASHGQ